MNPTPSQRLCMLHVLKNATEGLLGAIRLVEAERHDLTVAELKSILGPIHKNLGVTVANLNGGSFCPLECEACKVAAPYMGCEGSEHRQDVQTSQVKI